MLVVGIDPGEHTGVAVFDDAAGKHGGVVAHHTFYGTKFEWDAMDMSTLSGKPWKLENWREREVVCALHAVGVVVDTEPDLVVVEDFVLRGGKTHSSARAGLSADRIQAQIHALLLVGELMGSFQLLWYQASVAKTTITDARLKGMDLWIPGVKSKHARDALRHAIVGYRKVRGS